VDPLNPSPPASESEPEDVTKVENTIELEDETIPASVHEVEVDPLNPSLPTSESEPEDAIEVKNLIEHEDETVPASVHEVGESSTSSFIREDSDGLLPGLTRRDINSFFGR
nr:hypothetical protein [Tanacetum cinerariifolium]